MGSRGGGVEDGAPLVVEVVVREWRRLLSGCSPPGSGSAREESQSHVVDRGRLIRASDRLTEPALFSLFSFLSAALWGQSLA